MSDFAWPPVLWMSLLSAELYGVGTGDLRALFDQDGIRWWLAHGYKEPFAVIWIVTTIHACSPRAHRFAPSGRTPCGFGPIA